MTGIADVVSHKMKALRWFSVLNPEMDCIVYVPEDKADFARRVILSAMEKWDEDDGGLGYGDVIEEALEDADIPHVLLLPEWNSDGESCVCEWDEWADGHAEVI